MRQHGIQATREVQLAARRVARENVRLRQLLRHKGVDEDTISTWIREDESGADIVAPGVTPLEKATRSPSSGQVRAVV